MKNGTKVKIFAQVSNGAGDVTDAWTDGVVVNQFTVPASLRQATGQRPGIVVHVPQSAMKDKFIMVADDFIDTVVRRI